MFFTNRNLRFISHIRTLLLLLAFLAFPRLLAASTLTIPFPDELQGGTIYHTDGNGNPLITYVVNPVTLLAWGGSPLSGYTWTLANGSTFPPGTTVDALTGIFHGNGSPLVSGSHPFTMTVSDGSTTASATFSFTVTDDFVDPPASTPFEQLNVSTFALPNGTAGAGYGASLYADGGNPPYGSWTKATGALPPGMVIDMARGVVRGTPFSSASGTYSFTINVLDATGASALNPFNLTYTIAVAPTPSSPVLLQNISTRAQVLTGDNVMIGGFIITGADAITIASTPKKVVIRGIGPSLSNATPPVPGVLADPVLELHQTVGGINTILASNDNWKTNSAADQMTITDSGLDQYNALPISDLESIIVATLPSVDPNVIGSGAYTAIVSGTNNTTGVALVEVYDLDDPTTTTTELANISTRALVGTGDNILDGGIIVGPASNAGEVIVRAIGPSLAPGVADPLLDPMLTLQDENANTVASNDNWMTNSAADQMTITDSGLDKYNAMPISDLESIIVATLSAGLYTAIVEGVPVGTTGVGLVEFYHIPAPAPTPAAKQ